MRYAILVACAVLAACESQRGEPIAPQFSSGNAAAEVNGHTNYSFLDSTGQIAFQVTSFNARRAPDGTVTGEFELHNHDGINHDVKGTVSCVLVTGNEAVLAGRVTKSNIGVNVFWLRVRDNGEGANAPPDEWSDVVLAYVPTDPTVLCGTLQAPDLVPIQAGNIQVH